MYNIVFAPRQLLFYVLPPFNMYKTHLFAYTSIVDPHISEMSPYFEDHGSKCPPALLSWIEHCCLAKVQTSLHIWVCASMTL